MDLKSEEYSFPGAGNINVCTTLFSSYPFSLVVKNLCNYCE